jgi:hypothetical protein
MAIILVKKDGASQIKVMPGEKGGESGRPLKWGQRKARTTFSLTPWAIDELDKIAKKFNLSKSDLIEQLTRGRFQLIQKEGEAAEVIKKH